MVRAPGGLDVRDLEDVVVYVPESPVMPPHVFVEHDRFIGTPHVLSQRELCVYLDPAREWDPRNGPLGFLDRLYKWFEHAVASKFDPDTALYHAVGGRAHSNSDSYSVVVREELDDPRTCSLAWLTKVHEKRFDLHRSPPVGDAERVLVVRAQGPLYSGPGQTLRAVLDALDEPTRAPALSAWQRRAERALRADAAAVHLVLAVPRPTPGPVHLLIGRIDLRDAKGAQAVPDLIVDWCPVFDERPSISTRRDKDRPVNAFNGSDVVVLGCGGLGSWIAEYVVRGGCRSLDVVDYAQVTGGHLVRQNFTEDDVARFKAESLARHLRAIAPACDITHSVTASITPRTREVMANGGFIIDATVSTATALMLDALATSTPDRRAVVAQVATDVGSGSLGMVVVSPPGGSPGVVAIDEQTGNLVRGDGRLEPYFTFWDPSEEDELVPARGCSVPTFHGSAADIAAVAATQVNLIGRHAQRDAAGTYLFALPHTGVQPALHFQGLQIDP